MLTENEALGKKPIQYHKKVDALRQVSALCM